MVVLAISAVTFESHPSGDIWSWDRICVWCPVRGTCEQNIDNIPCSHNTGSQGTNWDILREEEGVGGCKWWCVARLCACIFLIHKALLKTTIVATLWNNLSCKVKVMAQFLYILYITVNVVTCAEQKSMYSHVSTLTFDQHQFHKFFVLWNC